MDCVVIGGSAGSTEVLKDVYNKLKKDFPWAIVICQHMHPNASRSLKNLFINATDLPMKEAEEKEELKRGVTYMASPNYHLLIERDHTFSFNIDERVCYSRPSINVLFESAALAFKDKLVGILLTGANDDGAAGLAAIKKNQGTTIIQDPKSAAYPEMPERALALQKPDFLLTPSEIIDLLNSPKWRGENFAGII